MKKVWKLVNTWCSYKAYEKGCQTSNFLGHPVQMYLKSRQWSLTFKGMQRVGVKRSRQLTAHERSVSSQRTRRQQYAIHLLKSRYSTESSAVLRREVSGYNRSAVYDPPKRSVLTWSTQASYIHCSAGLRYWGKGNAMGNGCPCMLNLTSWEILTQTHREVPTTWFFITVNIIITKSYTNCLAVHTTLVGRHQ